MVSVSEVNRPCYGRMVRVREWIQDADSEAQSFSRATLYLQPVKKGHLKYRARTVNYGKSQAHGTVSMKWVLQGVSGNGS